LILDRGVAGLETEGSAPGKIIGEHAMKRLEKGKSKYQNKSKLNSQSRQKEKQDRKPDRG